MKTIVITPENEKDFSFIESLLKRIGLKHRIISDEELEDMGLLKAMLSVERGDYVSEENIMKILDEK